MTNNLVELLAPAKDLECGIAAINCGADAVYIGAPKFGAREAAGNTLEDIAALVQYAHKYWAKVYVTVNTLLRDDEISPAVRLIHDLYQIGIDALIIQDVGLLECDLPPLPIIASTQMHNNTPARVAFLEKVGFQRAILARELDLDQIREIRKHTNIELEFFIHGALCVCYSGQCYLSYALGGRSGNRGQCAQPCRKLYSLVDVQGKKLIENRHLLSIRDLSLSEHLQDLIDAGVCSFKIEGRLKDKMYVSNVVAYYRQKLDRLGVQKSSSGKTRLDFEPDPTKTFNRGFSAHFLTGRGEKIGAIETPKMVGETLGTVISITRKSFTVDGSVPLHKGDGICFFGRSGALLGTMVNDVRDGEIFPAKMDAIGRGMLIYRNHDQEFLTRLEKSRAERKIAVSLTLRETADGLSLTAFDEDSNAAEFSIAFEKTPADKPERALETIRTQLAKTGNSDYECASVAIETSRAYFLPISTLNSLRRDALEKLTQARVENRPKLAGGPVINDAPYPAKKLSYLGNVLNRQAADFYRRHGVTEIEPAAETGLDMRDRKVMTTRYCLKHQLGLCKGQTSSLCPDPLTLIDEEGHKLELRFDCARCEMQVFLGSAENKTPKPGGQARIR